MKYVAIDNKIFDTAEECAKYEEDLKKKEKAERERKQEKETAFAQIESLISSYNKKYNEDLFLIRSNHDLSFNDLFDYLYKLN